MPINELINITTQLNIKDPETVAYKLLIGDDSYFYRCMGCY